MPVAAWVTIGVTVGLASVAYLIMSVWWASRISTQVEYSARRLDDIMKDLVFIRSEYVTKNELAARVDQMRLVKDKGG